MGKATESLLASGKISLDVDLRRGSWADRSLYKHSVTPSGSLAWARCQFGWGLRFYGDGGLTVPDHASLRTAGAWLIALVSNVHCGAATQQKLFSKKAGTPQNYEFLWRGASSSIVVDTNTTRIPTTVMKPQSGTMVAVKILNGIPRFFCNGFFSEGSGAITIDTTSTYPLYLGNYVGFHQLNGVASRFIILNDATIDDRTIVELYQEMMSERFPLRAYSFGQRISAPKDPPGVTALVKTDFTTRLADGRLADLSGNGWHGTVKPGFVAGPGMCGNALMATSLTRTYVEFGDVVEMNGAQKLSVVWYGLQGSAGATEVMLDKGNGLSSRIDINCTTTLTRVNMGENGTDLVTVPDASVGTPKVIGVVFDGSQQTPADRMRIHIDSDIPTKTGATTKTALPNNVGTPLMLGKLALSDTLPPLPRNEFFAIYPAALSVSQYEFIRKQIAGRCTFQLDMQRCCVSLANLVGPCEIPGTPFRVLDGTWKIGEDSSGKRWINSVATNNKHVYMPSTQAYGTWTCSVYHTTGDEYFAFASNCKDLGLASRNVCSILLTGTTLSLYRFGPSSSTVLMRSTSCIETGKKYKLGITRSSAGAFTVYIKGGAYLDWTKVTATSGTNPVTDATYTTSANCVLSTSPAASGGGFADFAFFAGALTIEQLREKCP
jgi:hypothetical protein